MKRIINVAHYGRKSTEKGLDQAFNSIDNQREATAAYLKTLPQHDCEYVIHHFEDGGFSGGTTDRPAFQRMMRDIAAGKIQMVVVNRVDRLSRSLIDFAQILDVFNRHSVIFVSTTQQFDTSTSMGRMTVFLLSTFAQFEREQIAERTREKIAATRRKGKYTGGIPILGFNVDVADARLIVNQDEAPRVRAIFELYLETESLLGTVQELDRRVWVNKAWITRKGRSRGGLAFTKTNLHKLLTNVTYIGRVRYKDEVHRGEHEAIVSEELFNRVQALLSRNGRSGGVEARNKHGALLKGILKCQHCNCSMSPSFATKGTRRYTYYQCTTAQKRGKDACPSRSVASRDMDRLVVQQIKRIGHDPELVRETIRKCRELSEAQIDTLQAEHRGLERDMAHWHQELLAAVGQPATPRLADLHERIHGAEQRLADLSDQLVRLGQHLIAEDDVVQSLAQFDTLWDSLSPHEQHRIARLLIERVDFDGEHGQVSITFHADGVRALAAEVSSNSEHVA